MGNSQMRASSRKSNNINLQPIPIPRDAILDILSRLPAKSVVRFRSCSIIHDPFFVNLHHTRSLTRDNGTALCLSFPDLSSSSTSLSFFEGKQGFRNFQLSHVDLRYSRLSEIINGVFCRHDCTSHRVDICNITTQEVTTLPKSTYIPIRAGFDADFEIVYEPRYSFGFNPSTLEYKVLNICSINRYTLQLNPNNGLSTREVSQRMVEFEIFTLGSGSRAGSWIKIDPSYPCVRDQLLGLSSDSVCVGGVIQWRHRLFDQEIFLAFDLPTVEGCLALMGHVISGSNRNKIDLWMLEDRRNQAWVKERIIFPLHSPCLWPVGSFRTGMILLVQHGYAVPAVWAAYYCDLQTKNLSMIQVPELKSVKLPCGLVGKPSDVILTIHAENASAQDMQVFGKQLDLMKRSQVFKHVESENSRN
ncbi:unnamed protein product [Dovyalis caffra]|uniref:F-box protein n=1 Tax=Dovyalis caffra TaxID=77055 RepID=A0AAV1R1J0_9ROSI|nr:unnamed protein product [Dovyalis caffra]